jgi:hypothetical protein
MDIGIEQFKQGIAALTSTRMTLQKMSFSVSTQKRKKLPVV